MLGLDEMWTLSSAFSQVVLPKKICPQEDVFGMSVQLLSCLNAYIELDGSFDIRLNFGR
jgi:hypothetical protein